MRLFWTRSPGSRRRRVRTGIIIIAGWLGVENRPAEAQDAAVDRLLVEGVRLREARRDREALEKFREAFERSGSPRAEAQMALAYQAVGALQEAESHLSSALSARHPWIRRNRKILFRELDSIRSRLGRVQVVASVDGARVTVNGRLEGMTPLSGPIYIEPGTHSVRVEARGYPSAKRTVEIGVGELIRLEFQLDTIRRPPRDSSRLPLSELPRVTMEDSEPSVHLDSEPSPPTLDIIAWSLAGSALVGVGVGVAALVVRNDDIGAYNSDACLENARTRDENCGDRLDAARSAETVATAAFIASGALAVGAVSLMLATRGSKESEPDARGDGTPKAKLRFDVGPFAARCVLSF